MLSFRNQRSNQAFVIDAKRWSIASSLVVAWEKSSWPTPAKTIMPDGTPAAFHCEYENFFVSGSPPPSDASPRPGTLMAIGWSPGN